MSGNVWEWCVDEYASSYSTAAGSVTAVSGKNLVSADAGNDGKTSGAPLRNPIAYPSSGSARVYRGGRWNLSAAVCSLGGRTYGTPDNVNSHIGFRVVGCP
jgi:formylglycine-generating enzyme required for sulfatase activity